MRGNQFGWRQCTTVSALLLLLAACSKQAEEAAGSAGVAASEAVAMQGESNRAGSALAYAHEASIRMDGQAIAARVATVRKACMDGRFGTCSVLGEEQGMGESPSGRLQVRATPAAIEPLVKLASEGAEIGQRSTQAEDLADAVRDNGMRQRRLTTQHAKLSELMERKDIKIEELIALTQQLATLEAELQSVDQEAAQQRRRIETNLLTLHFHAAGVSQESSQIRRAFRGLGSTWDASIGVLITVVGALLPFVVFALLAWWLAAVIKRRRND